MKKSILVLVTIGLLASCKKSAETTPAPETPETTTVDILQKKPTGVLKNGDATAENPAFTETGGEVATWDNIVRAETAKYFAAEQIESGTNKFRHERSGIDLKNQTVIRSNFDLIYSYAVYDISGGLKITVPPYDLYHIVHVLDENSVTIGVCYPGKTLELKASDATYGSHVYLFMRTQSRSNDAKGMEEMRKRQDAVVVEAGSNKPFVPEVKYDVASFNKLRKQIITDAVTRAVIEKGFVDNIKDISTPQYQYINLAGWAGLPAKHAYYFVVLPGDEAAKNGEPSSVTFKKPDLKYGESGYWSLTIYDEQGWVVTDPFHLNSHQVKPNPDGTITLNFNGGPDAINNIKVPKNWNGLFRCYLPVSVPSMIAYKEDFTKNHKVVAVKK
ncbi:DUF1254 domain-containing protein [Flavobacterium agrisoli]|uniref:DUF1254 domain-containing protein n=1 Tax=Flavobacterium agrisoli TaxID=2793066 RepID=A0A934PLY8_9FLAO|nr:DUF1254 domain-containing protein [Flavobacterium agrisoli]MBK0369274.1 DUF1254 domain-containing protein [Flavobacterium agrisoli]